MEGFVLRTNKRAKLRGSLTITHIGGTKTDLVVKYITYLYEYINIQITHRSYNSIDEEKCLKKKEHDLLTE